MMYQCANDAPMIHQPENQWFTSSWPMDDPWSTNGFLLVYQLPHDFPLICHRSTDDSPIIHQCFTDELPSVCRWFTIGLPMIFQRFTNANDFSVIHHWYAEVLPIIYQWSTSAVPMIYQLFAAIYRWFTSIRGNENISILAPSRCNAAVDCRWGPCYGSWVKAFDTCSTPVTWRMVGIIDGGFHKCG